MIDDATFTIIWISTIVSAVTAKYLPSKRENLFKDIGIAALTSLIILIVAYFGLMVLEMFFD